MAGDTGDRITKQLHIVRVGLVQAVLKLREGYPRWGKDKLVILLLIAVLWIGFDVLAIKRILRLKKLVDDTAKKSNQKYNKK